MAILRWDAEDAPSWAPESAPESQARRAILALALGLDDQAAAVFSTVYPLTVDGSVLITDEFDHWYTPERRQQHEFYWAGYKRQLLEVSHWSASAVAKLDKATTQVVERLAEPTREQQYQARGLVVGYVQSGKTANFTGVTAKAIDAGYRLVIVMTGTMNILRRQTQRRMDMEMVGIENIFRNIDPDDADLASKIDYFNDDDRRRGKFLKHGFVPSEQGFPDIIRLTDHAADYKSLNNGITALEMQKRNRQKPLYSAENLYHADARVAIIKKNSSVLKRLVRDLGIIRTRLGEIPTLIIDDESDQASPNTRDPKKWAEGQTERTAINGHISELLKLLPRAQYVGYTATPYANVFIDPGDAADIFPRDFLLSLERPEGYMGVVDFHDLNLAPEDTRTLLNSNEKALVRDVVPSDDGEEDNVRLRDALDTFLVAGALKLYRERAADGAITFRHHTMLVHESVRMVDHKALGDLIQDLWKNAQYQMGEGLARLEQVLDQDFRPVSAVRAPDLPFPSTFSDLRPFVAKAYAKITESDNNPVLIVNGDKAIEQQQLDFEGQPIWRVLVGGAKLSRGFTIEGLTTSYYRRRTNQADTLMQMGRWFGFRSGYADLVRLFIGRAEANGSSTIDLYEAFEAIVRDEESFRDQLRRYSTWVDGKPQITPRQIPPLVSQHLPQITPSARNKMFNAELVLRRTPGRALEPTAYPKDAASLRTNLEDMLPLFMAASERLALTSQAEPGDASLSRVDAYVGCIDAATVLSVLRSLKWLRPDDFAPDLAFIEEITGDAVEQWMVLAPQLADPGHTRSFPGVGERSVFVRQRRRGDLFGAISDPKHRAIAQVIAGSRDNWGDAALSPFVSPLTGAIILYPVVESLSTPIDQAVAAFTLTAPAGSGRTDGRVVQFKARDSSAPKAVVVDRQQ